MPEEQARKSKHGRARVEKTTMPTLPVIKTAYPGKEAQGGQLRLSLPRLRLSVQPAPGTTPVILSLSKDLTAARPLALSRNLPLVLSLSKDARPRSRDKSESANPLLPILRQAQDDGGTPQDDAGTPLDDGGTPQDDAGTPLDEGSSAPRRRPPPWPSPARCWAWSCGPSRWRC